MRALQVTVDKHVSYVDLDGLESMQRVVGGYIERVEMEDGCSLYLNEEGKIYGLPFNSIATDLALSVLGLDPVVGDVFVTGPGDGRGGDTSINLHSRTARKLRKITQEAGGTWDVPKPLKVVH